MNDTSHPALALREITRTFSQGSTGLHVLNGANLDINGGEIVALVGPSGAGKSTLLQISGLLEHPTSGEVWIGSRNTNGLRDSQRTELRRSHLGFVYQYHHLLPEFTALENIVVPQMIAGVRRSKAEIRAMALLTAMGLSKRAKHRPGELSGGEQQRVAIGRALANRPRLLLADEPTGNLDPNTAEHVFQILMERVREEGLAALIATHNPGLAKRMDRIVTIRDGRIEPFSAP